MLKKIMKLILGAAIFFGLAAHTAHAGQWVWKNVGLSEVILIDTDGEAIIEESISWDIYQPFDIPLYLGLMVAEDLINYDDIGAPTVGPTITFDFARHFGWNAPPEPGTKKWDIGFNLEIGVIPISYDFDKEDARFGIIASIIKIEF